jgi:hypothetical protein
MFQPHKALGYPFTPEFIAAQENQRPRRSFGGYNASPPGRLR